MDTATIEAPTTIGRTFRLALASASIAAGLIHAIAAPHHLDEDPVLGTAFIGAAVFQVLWAVPATMARAGRVFDAGAIVNGTIIVGWIVSRTVGLPLGPHAWIPEAPGALDIAATTLELLIVSGSLLVAPQSAAPWVAAETRPPSMLATSRGQLKRRPRAPRAPA